MKPLLVFDLGNVLLKVSFSRFAARVTKDSTRLPDEVLYAFCSSSLKALLDRGTLAAPVFVQQIQEWLGEGAPDLAEVKEAWCDIFEPIPEAVEHLRFYQAKYDTWLLSDTDPMHFVSVLNCYPWVRDFDRYLLSFDRGMLKKDRGAFDLFGEEVARRKVIFVDDLPVNVKAAKRAGLEGVLFEDWEQVRREFAKHGIEAP